MPRERPSGGVFLAIGCFGGEILHDNSQSADRETRRYLGRQCAREHTPLQERRSPMALPNTSAVTLCRSGDPRYPPGDSRKAIEER